MTPARLVALLVVILTVGAGALWLGAAPAAAQPARPAPAQPAAHGHDDAPRAHAHPVPPGVDGKSTPRTDVRQGSGKDMAVLFWIFAAACIAGSIFVITRRNLISAVMGMVGTFFGVAALYMMLYSNFLGVIQMLVYAGAIMVLFVFVIMVLNKPEDEPWVERRALAGKILALVAMGYLLLRLVMVLTSVVPPGHEAAAAPQPVMFGTELYDWGSTAAVGKELFTDGLFPFEAISILLLIAVVGAIAIARPLKDDDAA